MKVLNKIKSIYLLTIIAILSFCMLLFPAMPKTANADGETLGSGTITIKSFSVMAQTFEYELNSEGTSVPCDPYDKWAISFKAEITKEQFDIITNNGTVNARFGMLIGRTSRTEGIEAKDIATIIGAKKDGGLAFEAFAHVGLGLGAQQIEFEKGNKTFEFEAGIVYNEKTNLPEGKTLIDMASYDLTAIPFYMNGATIEESTEIEILFDAKKNVVPKDVLVNSYAYQQVENDGAPYEEGAVPFSDHIMKTFAGEIDFFEGDAYVCRSTNRLMVEGENGVLAPADIDTVAYYNKRVDITAGVEGKADTLDSTFVGGLEKNGKGCVINYSANNEVTVYYGAKTAERVITRFADTTVGTTATNDTADYLAKAGTDKYTSIFAVNNDIANIYATSSVSSEGVYPTANNTYGQSVVYVSMDKGYDGLYVLGNNITFVADGEYLVYTGKSFDLNRKSTAASSATQSFVPPIYGLGFNGIFDGRGFYVDADSKANQGILPPAFDATIKNTAFLNLTQTGEGGGITAHARLSNFENIYATVSNVVNNRGDFNKGVLMNVQECDFKNFVAFVDVADKNIAAAHASATGTALSKITGNISASNTATGMGHGQGVRYAGVFSFRAYPDMYYDKSVYQDAQGEAVSGVRYMQPVANGAVVGEFVEDIKADLTVSEIERLFSNAIIVGENGKEDVSRYGFNIGTTNVANPSPFTKNNDYNGTAGGGTRKYADKLHNAFVGTTGQNVYTIGSSPLYLAHQFIENSANVGLAGNSDYKTTTVFVNEAPTLVGGGKADMNWKLVDGKYVAPTAYTWNQIDSNMFEIAFTDESGTSVAGSLATVKGDTFLSLGEIIVYGKSYSCAPSKIKSLCSTSTTGNNIANILVNGSPQTTLDVQFVNQAGFYDVATVSDMAQYVNDNIAKGIEFDSAFWKVENGVATWRNLPTQA